MLLKKLSLALFILIGFNACSMEKKYSPKTLKRYCAKVVLQSNLITEILPIELKTYLKHLHKSEELRKHRLARVFKKYLLSCCDYMQLNEIQQLMKLIDKANEISTEKCLIAQKMLAAGYKTLFCEAAITIFISSLMSNFSQTFAPFLQETVENIKTFYNNKGNNAENKKLLALSMLESLQTNLLTLDSDCILTGCKLAESGYVPALHRIGLLTSIIFGAAAGIDFIKQLIKIGSIDYAADLIFFMLTTRYDIGLFSNKIEFFHKQKFCKILNNFISITSNESNNYNQTLALIYNYLGNVAKAKECAEEFLGDNDGVICTSIFKLLRDIYHNEGKFEEEKFYSDKFNELVALNE